MTIAVKIAPVRKVIRVNASAEVAFEVFTAGMSRWWFKTHSINPSKSPLKEAIMEPRAGGRWYEKGEDGSECDWGRVLAWEPPSRLLLAWQIDGQWRYDPNLVTEVEVRFAADGAGVTRVELEHRDIDRFGDSAEMVRNAFDSAGGWTGLLENFAKIADLEPRH
ncbi:MAG TPA: SRPBCC family protein [Roseiarcus sp.]|nr:SRPBCC family protein [Roseiarcus sp.]